MVQVVLVHYPDWYGWLILGVLAFSCITPFLAYAVNRWRRKKFDAEVDAFLHPEREQK